MFFFWSAFITLSSGNLILISLCGTTILSCSLDMVWEILVCTHANKTNLELLLELPGERHYFMLRLLKWMG